MSKRTLLLTSGILLIPAFFASVILGAMGFHFWFTNPEHPSMLILFLTGKLNTGFMSICFMIGSLSFAFMFTAIFSLLGVTDDIDRLVEVRQEYYIAKAKYEKAAIDFAEKFGNTNN